MGSCMCVVIIMHISFIVHGYKCCLANPRDFFRLECILDFEDKRAEWDGRTTNYSVHNVSPNSNESIPFLVSLTSVTLTEHFFLPLPISSTDISLNPNLTSDFFHSYFFPTRYLIPFQQCVKCPRYLQRLKKCIE